MVNRAPSKGPYVASPRYNPDQLRSLQDLDHVTRTLTQRQTDLVAQCRDFGLSWADIGEVFGITGGAAHNRYGPKSEFGIL